MNAEVESDDLPTRDSRPRILVVEPNRRYLAVLARRLAERGYRPVMASDGASAIAEIHRSSPALVLSDYWLAGTTGLELLRIVRDDPAKRHLPVLLIVGRSDPVAAIRSFEAGADAVIRKPCHFDVLGACIARHLERAKCLQQLLDDKAALDARIVSRAIELGEARARWQRSESEREAFQTLVERAA